MLDRRLFARALLLAPLAATTSTPAAASADAQALLAASDAVRNPGQPFVTTVTLTEFRAGRRVDGNTLVSYSRVLERGGQFATLLRFVAPARDAGKLMLRNGSDMWFFDPNTQASVRLSPQQRLLGQAANGDVVTVNLARDYRATLLRDEDVQDGERRARRAHLLELNAATADATYGRIHLWIDSGNQWPIKGHFFSDSGRLLKTVFYRRFEPQLGAQRPTEMVIIDGVDPQSVTVMRLSEWRARDLPATWFQRDFLPRYQPER